MNNYKIKTSKKKEIYTSNVSISWAGHNSIPRAVANRIIIEADLRPSVSLHIVLVEVITPVNTVVPSEYVDVVLKSNTCMQRTLHTINSHMTKGMYTGHGVGPLAFSSYQHQLSWNLSVKLNT